MGQQFLIDEILKPEDLDTTQLKINDSLNQKIWDGEKLKPKVRIHLLKIAQNFINFLNIDDDVEIHDIIFTGSLSNYNFNDYSDIDLHVILDHKEVIEDPDLAKEYFDTKKVLWNDRFDIKIYGFEVECYAQDAN